MRANEKGVFDHEKRVFLDGDETISGKEARMRPVAMHQLAAKVGEEWARKEKERKKKDKAAALLQRVAAAVLRQEERKRKRASE